MFNFFRILFSPVIAILDFITKYFKTIVFLTIMYFILVDTNEGLTDTNSFANLQKIQSMIFFSFTFFNSSVVPNPVLHGSEQLYFLTICRKMSNNAERFLLRAPPFQC